MNPSLLLDPLRPVLRPAMRSPMVPPARRVSSPISFVGRSTVVSNTTGLNANVDRSTLTTMKVGDRLILIQLSTSAPTVTPAGYTQVAQVTSGSFSQIVTIWGKTAVTADLSGTVTVSQTASGVQQAVLLALRGIAASPVPDVIQTGTVFQNTSNPQPMVGATALHDGLVIATCCPTGTAGGVSYAASAGWTVPIGATFNSRLGIAYKTCKANDVISGTITCDNFPNGTSKSWSKTTITYK